MIYLTGYTKLYSGYHHNFVFGTFGRHSFGGHPQNTNTQENIGSSIVNTTLTTTSTMSSTTAPVPTAPFTNNMWAINLSTTPSPVQDQHQNSSQVPSQGNLYYSCGGGIYQTSTQGGRGTQGGIQLPTLEKLPPSKPSITLEKPKAIKELKEDQSWVVLTADKGVAMVVIDREDYSEKAKLLLADTNTYKPFTKDPTKKPKKKLT